MDKVYQIMQYEYDGCGQSWYEPKIGEALRRSLESAEKAVEDYAGWGSHVYRDDYYGLVAVNKSGRYAYERIYIAELELED